jgi:hypothetical protein
MKTATAPPQTIPKSTSRATSASRGPLVRSRVQEMMVRGQKRRTYGSKAR